MLHTLYFIRHGESMANVGGPVMPDKQVGLTERGLEQALSLTERLSHVHASAIYTSELRRTQQTAAPLCEQWELLSQILPCLNELCNLEFAHIANVSVDDFLGMASTFSNDSLLFTHGIWIGMLAWKLLGFDVRTRQDMQQFRQFQTAMNMKNTISFANRQRYRYETIDLSLLILD